MESSELKAAKINARKKKPANRVPAGITVKSFVKWMNARPVFPEPTAAMGSEESAKMVGIMAIAAIIAADVSAKQMVVAFREMSSVFFA